MGGTRYITQKALTGMSAQRTASIQEAVHMVDNQDLVICSETFTYLSLRQSAVLTSEKDGQKRKDIQSPCIETVVGILPISCWMNISTATFAGRCSKKRVTALIQQSTGFFCRWDKIANLATQSHMTMLREYSFNTGLGPKTSR